LAEELEFGNSRFTCDIEPEHCHHDNETEHGHDDDHHDDDHHDDDHHDDDHHGNETEEEHDHHEGKNCSLVPRPSLGSVFDYTERKSLG